MTGKRSMSSTSNVYALLPRSFISPRADLPPYEGPPRPAEEHPDEWGVADLDQPD